MPTIHNGDCIETMKAMPPESVDAIVCDPPYGLSNTTPAQVADTITKWAGGDRGHVPTGRGFMGKSWDAFVPPPAVWDECLRVLKPGGHMVVFAGSRTHDLMGLSIRLAGFEMRDSLAWLYGSGFPKSHDVGKAIDKLAGAEREVIGSRHVSTKGSITSRAAQAGHGYRPPGTEYAGERKSERAGFGLAEYTAPATPEAQQWDGWGTALKPAFEPIVLARKPFPGTVARNVLEHGTGAINVDACRIESGENLLRKATAGGSFRFHGFATLEELKAAAAQGGTCPDGADARKTLARYEATKDEFYGSTNGRWPANVVLDQHAAAWVDEQSGVLTSGSRSSGLRKDGSIYGAMNGENPGHPASSGGASRFFYTAKAPKSERPNVDGVQHPTVKPLAIMRWLIRLVTPPGGTVLDPFAGSGTTIEAAIIEGFNPVGIEMEADYLPLIQHRIDRQAGTLTA